MSKKIVAGILGVVCSMPVWADVLVQVPEQLIMVAINDQEVRSGLFNGKNNTYKLDAGSHQISVKYQELFEENYINHDIVRSNIVTLNTGNLKDGQTYQLVMVNPPKDHESAKKFAERPVIGLKDSQGNLIAQQEGASSKAKPWFGASLFNVSGDRTVDLRQEQKAIAPVTAVKAQEIVTVDSVVTPVASVAAAQAKDQQLIDLWKSATPQERQKFAAWLAEQASK